MTRKEIEEILRKNDSTVLSYKDRGPWGDNKYRGNCSGYIQALLQVEVVSMKLRLFLRIYQLV